MALNLKLADAYVDLSLRTQQFDSGYAKVMSQLKSVPTLRVGVNVDAAQFRRQMVSVRAELTRLQRYSIRLQVDRGSATANLGLLRQQMQALKAVGGANIPIRADLRQWTRAIVQIHTDLQRVKVAANIPIQTNTSRAHANLSLLLQQLRTLQSQSKFTFTGTKAGWWPNRGMLGGGGGGFGMGGPGFMSGLWSGAGMPFAANPQMMAGELASKAIIGSVQTAAELESEFATLRRITGFTSDELNKFKNNLMTMSTSRPGVSTVDLIQMSQVGARMGVADKGGLQGLTDFTNQLARVRLAVEGMDTENLANQMGKVLGVFELGTDRVAGFGSALVAMDNMSKASAADILSITQRLSGFAKSANLTLPQVLALSSVLKDVGLANEVAGSAMSRILAKMVTGWKEMAETVGIDAEKFKDAIQRDPLEALQMVIEKFGELKDTIGKQEFLAEIGLKNSRDLATFQQLAPLALSGEITRRAKIASAETGSTKSLNDAEKIMGDTTSGSFQKTKNSIVDLADAAGSRLSPVARTAANALSDVASGLASIIRGTNQASFSAPRETAAKALEALPEKNAPTPESQKPKTVEEAQAAYDAAKARSLKAEDEAAALHKQADTQGFNARDLLRQSIAKPELNTPAIAAVKEADETKAKAAAASEESVKAGEALRAALEQLKDAQAEQRKKDQATQASNTIADLKSRFANTVGAVAEARRSLLGVGVKTVAGVIGPADKEGEGQAHGFAGIGTSTMAAGQRIQEDILRSGGKNAAVEKTEKNTRDAVGLLGELKDILARNANQIGGAVLAR